MKNLNNLAYTLLIAILLPLTTFAQEDTYSSGGFYFRLGGGYSFQAGKTEFNNADPNGLTGIEQSTDISFQGTNVIVKSLNGTLGGGAKFNFTAGYMFNKYLGAELGLNYFNGEKVTVGKLNAPTIQSEEEAYLRGFDLAPALYLTPGFDKVNPFTRFGLLMTVGGKLTIDNSVYAVDGVTTGTDLKIDALAEVKGKFSVGYSAAAGVEFPINDKFKIFGEIEYKNFSIKSKSAEIVEYSAYAVTDGQSQLVQTLADLPVSEKEFIFKDEYTESLTTPADENEPRKIPTQFINASGTGINVGLKYSF